MKLVWLGLSWVLGVYLGAWAGFSWGVLGAIAGAALLALVLRRRNGLLLAACLFVLLGGILRFESTVPAVDGGALAFYNDSGTVRIRGLVADDPEGTGSGAAFRFEAREVEVAGGWTEVSGAALVYAPVPPSPGFSGAEGDRDPPYYRYGDMLLIEGQLESPPQLEGFDWPDYLARQGVYSVVRHPGGIEFLDSGAGFMPREWLYETRHRMSESLGAALGEPQASLAKAVLLGERGGIPEELRDALSRTGTAHVIAISGLHIGIAGGMALSVLVWLLGRRRPTYVILALAVIWGYACLTGLQPPAARAAIMVSLWLFAEFIGRPRSALPSLVLAAALMVGITPSILGEVSFQMSFAAMAGLVLLTPRFRTLLRSLFRLGEEGRTLRGLVCDALSVTLGALVTTMPVIAYYFERISLVALPANLAAVPALPGAIGAAALVAIVGLFAPHLALVLGWVAWLFAGYMIEVVDFFAGLPFASVEVDFGAPYVWTCYALLAAALWATAGGSRAAAVPGKVRARLGLAAGHLRKVPVRLVVLPLLVAAALVWTAAATAPDGRLHVFVLDVGQGDAILVQRGRTQVLVDGGPDAEAMCLHLGERLPFWDRTLELVVLTHPDADHVTGLTEVVQLYGVERMLSGAHEGGSRAAEEWLRALEREGIACTAPRAGQRVVLSDGLVLEVLHPQGDPLAGTVSEDDDNSVVIRLVYGDFSMLLTGDISGEAETYLLDRRFTLRSTVLKVAHHGSGGSTCPEFLSAVGPQVAVVSVGADNPFGHPAPEVTERLVGQVGEDGLYLTSEHGTVELITDGERLWVRTEE